MGKKRNLKSCRFGHWLVLEESDKRDSGGNVYWWCRCDCGTVREVAANRLIRGKSLCCGCDFGKNVYREIEDGMECTVENGRKFYIDKEDYEKVRSLIWTVREHGEVSAHLRGSNKGILLHRFLLGDVEGDIDHIDLHPENNRRSNLRVCSHQQNCFNNGLRPNNKTGLKGVCWDSERRKFAAYLRKDNIKRYLGRFDDPFQAAFAYDEAALFYFGEYCKTNFGEGGIYDGWAWEEIVGAVVKRQRETGIPVEMWMGELASAA